MYRYMMPPIVLLVFLLLSPAQAIINPIACILQFNVVDFLNCYCPLNLCQSDQENGAWTLYGHTADHTTLAGMPQYRTNWINCAICSAYRICLPTIQNAAFQNGMNTIKSYCTANYGKMGLACPEVCLISTVNTASGMFPESPFVQYSEDSDSCLDQYNSKPPNIATCFATANSLYTAKTLPYWAPKTNTMTDYRVGNINMVYNSTVGLVNSLISDPNVWCPSCNTASTVPDVLNCKCCWNICRLQNVSNAWKLFTDMKTKEAIREVAEYRQNWDNCMKCSVLRVCMSTYEAQIRDEKVKKGLNSIRSRCQNDYKTKNLACPEVCIMAIYQKAANLMPTSPFYSLYNDITSCASRYSNTENPQALVCFGTANSLYVSKSLPTWIPSVNPVDNIFRGGKMIMDSSDTDTLYNELCTDPVVWCPNCSSASDTITTLNCNCCWNICQVTKPTKAWQLFVNTQSKATIDDVHSYRQNWDDCMQCYLLRQCIGAYQSDIQDTKVLNGLTGIDNTCLRDYQSSTWECPEVCIISLYQKAAELMPTSPMNTLYRNIRNCVSSYSDKEKPEALKCFGMANSLIRSNPLPNWIPTTDPVDKVKDGSMDMTDLNADYNALCANSTVWCPDCASLSTVSDTLNCECCWNICQVDLPTKAWQLFGAIQTYQTVDGMKSYRDNWDNCMQCSLLRESISIYERDVLDVYLQNGLGGIHETCKDIYLEQGLECPEVCVMTIYEKAAALMPTSSFYSIYNATRERVSSYTVQEKPNALECFKTLNSLPDSSSSSVDWIPETTLVDDIAKGKMVMDGDIGILYDTLCNQHTICPNCTSATDVSTTLDCNCCYNVCQVTESNNAWELFQNIGSNKNVVGVALYHQNWDNCMKCSILRTCIRNHLPQGLTSKVQTGLNSINSKCRENFDQKHWACPEICIMSLYQKAADLMPTSPFYSLYSDINTCVNSYSDVEKKPYALDCFVTANTYLDPNSLSNWVPVDGNILADFIQGSWVMQSEDLAFYYQSLFTDPTLWCPDCAGNDASAGAVLDCKCCWDICRVNNSDSNALKLYQVVRTAGVANYLGGWANCIKCAKGLKVVDDIINTAEPFYKTGLQMIRDSCVSRFSGNNWDCPLDCITKVMSAISRLSAYVSSYNGYISKPSTPSHVFDCFVINNKFYNEENSLPEWTILFDTSFSYRGGGTPVLDDEVIDITNTTSVVKTWCNPLNTNGLTIDILNSQCCLDYCEVEEGDNALKLMSTIYFWSGVDRYVRRWESYRTCLIYGERLKTVTTTEAQWNDCINIMYSGTSGLCPETCVIDQFSGLKTYPSREENIQFTFPAFKVVNYMFPSLTPEWFPREQPPHPYIT